MIIDFNSPASSANFQARVCIIGAGAIGLTLASEFINYRDVDVLIVESGDLVASKETSGLDNVVNTGDVDSAVEGSRARVFGGSTTIWGGQALPFSPMDFSSKDWVKNSGWPIKFEQVEQFYQRASNILGLDNAEFSENIWRKKKENKKVLIDGQALELGYSKWSPQPDFAKRYKRIIEKSKHITTLINASVTQIVCSSSADVINGLELKSLAGKQGFIRADIFVLCCGGIENPRLLLASNSQMKAGVGNHDGNVGKYYQDHIGVYGARLVPKDFNAFHSIFATVLDGSQKSLPKLNLSEKTQSAKKLLNVNGNISIQSNNDSAINNLKHIYESFQANGLNKQAVSSLLKLSKSPIELWRIFDSYYLRHRKYFPPDATFFLIANGESEPIEQSVITLNSQSDALGMPIANINWKLTELSRKSLVTYYKEVKKSLQQSGIAEVIIRPELLESGDENWKARCYSLYHHMGATRMNISPKLGVVDANCKVHDVSNLFIAGSSVFPTSSASNPTYTAIALAIRLADQIKKETTI